MPIIKQIAANHDEMRRWRRDIHAHPETAFEELRTSARVAELLESFGLRVTTGLAKTGIVGSLENGDGPSIGLRADMDALDIDEANDFDHASKHPGKMHACGHDGHTTMLLGAAKYLAETRRFKGTVHFIFQPAEENEAGGRVMVEEGLFDRFPVDSVFGLHNWPGQPVGTAAIRSGPMMAACDNFELQIIGRGCHAAMPHLGIDPVVIASEIIQAFQTIPSRSIDPFEAAVVSVTQVHGGDTWNVIPEKVLLRGTARSFMPTVQDAIEPKMRQLAEGIAQAHGASIVLDYQRRYPATINHKAETEIAARAMADVIGEENLGRSPVPSMGAEDFAYMLQVRPGSYIWLGNGPTEGGCMLHNPHYDFNDDLLPIGASYWARLVETTLPASS